VGLPAFGTLFVPAAAMIGDGADRRGLHHGLAYGLANLAWAAGQGVAAAGSGALDERAPIGEKQKRDDAGFADDERKTSRRIPW